VTQASVAYESASSSIEHVEEDCEASVDGYRLSKSGFSTGDFKFRRRGHLDTALRRVARRSLQRLRYIQ